FSSSFGCPNAQSALIPQTDFAKFCKNEASGTAPEQLETTPRTDNHTLNNLILSFSQNELCSYVEARVMGLSHPSRD
ncbi:MAG: hypothetical protein ACXV4C_07640, partial [Halobacteriota archaeon]